LPFVLVTKSARLKSSRALWNRSELGLRSDEILAQLLDQDSLEDWRALARLAKEAASLRHAPFTS
jgi:hypothetical protein